MDQLAAEYSRTHDVKIKAEILGTNTLTTLVCRLERAQHIQIANFSDMSV